MFAKQKYNHLLLVYIAINNCVRQNVIANKWHAMLIALSAFVISKCRWLRLTVSQVSLVLIVNVDACMQAV